MKGLRYHITSLYLLVASLALVAQNTTPTFVVDYKSADPATVSQKGIGFAKSSNGSQYSLSDDGKYHSQQDVGKIRHINRYHEPPVTHVYTDDSSSEAVVKEYRSDGTVVLDAATVKDVPQVGEIIVSGVTDAAPYGFLKHVESVKKANGQIVITTSDASLNEVLYDTHIEQRLVFREADAEGSAVYLYPKNGPMYANNAELLHLKKKFEVFERPGGKISFLGKDIDEYCKGSVNVDLTLGGTFIWDSDGWIPDRIGLSLDGSLSLSVVIEAGLKLEKDEDKLTWKVGPEIPLQPIVFPAGMVPVVIVPVVQFKLGIRSAEGKLYAKWKPIDLEAATFDAHAIWIREGNKDGDNWDFGADCSSDLTDMSIEGLFQDMLNAEAGLTGEAKFSVWPEVRFKLYDTDNVSMAVGVAPFAKLSGDLALKWQNSSSADVLDEFELKDNISLGVGIDVPLEGKVKFNVFGKIIGGAKNASLTLLEKDLIQTGSFIPVFNDFRITPDEDVKKWNSAHVSAYEGLSIFSKYESDFGFCMAQVMKDASGKELPREWDYHSLKSKYSGSSYGADMQLKIEWDIPTDDLLYNATYEVRPYTVLSIMSTPYWFWRKGGTFTTGEGGDNLKLSTTTLTLTPRQQATVDITSGSGSYEAVSNAKTVATVTVSGSKLTIKGVSPGPATITVQDNKTQQRAKIDVTVSNILSDGLVAYYPFNSSANDESGNGNHGILAGKNLPLLTTDRHGRENSAYEFGGYYNPNWIRVPNSESLKFDKTFTISFWIQQNEFVGMDEYHNYSSTHPMFATICKAGDGNAVYPGLYNITGKGNDGKGLWFESNNSNGNAHDKSKWNHHMSYSLSDYQLGQWLHIAIVIDNTQKIVYMNGQEVARDALKKEANFTSMNQQDLYIGIYGSSSPSWFPFLGKIDDIRIYRIALTPDEVLSLSNE